MTTPYRPQLNSQADLEEAWRHLIRPLGFHRRSVWLMLIDAEGRPTPVVTEVTDLPEVVDLETTQGLGEMLAQLLGEVEPQGRWAFLLSRPGTHATSHADRAWAAGLYDTCHRHQLAHEVVHLANDESITPIPLDEVTDYLQAS